MINNSNSRRDTMNNKVIKKLLITLPEEFKETLQSEAEKQHRTLNGYILWLLANRPKKENPAEEE